MTTATKTTTERIAELEATPRALIGSDEGTHGAPTTHRLYEEITGERYAVRQFGGDNGTRCTIEDAREGTNGRIIDFPNSLSQMRAAQRELAALKKSANR